MVITSRHLAFGYRLAAVLLIGWGLIRLIAPFGDTAAWSAMLYYTSVSNVLGLSWMLAQLVRTGEDLTRRGARGTSTVSARLGGAVMMAITVTMLIYLIVLAPSSFVQEGDYEPFTLTDTLIHVIAPMLLIGDWLLFTPKGRLTWRDPFLWLLIPIAYMVFAYGYAGLGGDFGTTGRYPYPFLDIDALGLGGVATQVGIIAVGLVAVGVAYVFIDRRLARTRAAGTPLQGAP